MATAELDAAVEPAYWSIDEGRVLVAGEGGPYRDESEARADLGLPANAAVLSNCWARSQARYCSWCFAPQLASHGGKCPRCGAVMGRTLSHLEALHADARLGGERRMREWGGAV